MPQRVRKDILRHPSDVPAVLPSLQAADLRSFRASGDRPGVLEWELGCSGTTVKDCQDSRRFLAWSSS